MNKTDRRIAAKAKKRKEKLQAAWDLVADELIRQGKPSVCAFVSRKYKNGKFKLVIDRSSEGTYFTSSKEYNV